MKSTFFAIVLLASSLCALNNEDVLNAQGLANLPANIAAVNYLRNTLAPHERINAPSIHEILETVYLRSPLPNGLNLLNPPIDMILSHATAREYASRFFHDPSRTIITATQYLIANIGPHPSEEDIVATENMQNDIVLAPMFNVITRDILDAYMYLRSVNDRRYISKQFIRNTVHLRNSLNIQDPNLDDLFYVSRFFHRVGRMPSHDDIETFDNLLTILPVERIGKAEFNFMLFVEKFLGTREVSRQQYFQAAFIGEAILNMEGAKDLGLEQLGVLVNWLKNELGVDQPTPRELEMLFCFEKQLNISKPSKKQWEAVTYLLHSLKLGAEKITDELLNNLYYLQDELSIKQPAETDLTGLAFMRNELGVVKPTARQFAVTNYAVNSLMRQNLTKDFLNTLDHCMFNLNIKDPSNAEIDFIVANQSENGLGKEITTLAFFRWLRERALAKNSNGFIAVAPKDHSWVKVIWQAETRDMTALTTLLSENNLKNKPNKNIKPNSDDIAKSIVGYKFHIKNSYSKLGLEYYKLKNTNRIITAFNFVSISNQNGEVTLK